MDIRLKMRPAILAVSAVAALATGCAETPQLSERQKGTATGAAVGAVGGAVLSKATGGNAATGAVVGGAIGAVAGNLWSKRMEDKRAEMQQRHPGHRHRRGEHAGQPVEDERAERLLFRRRPRAVKPQMRPVLDQFAQGLDPNMRVR